MNYLIKEAYDNLNEIKSLFNEYALSLGIDLSFQNYDGEINSLPGKYALPAGRLYLLYVQNIAAGCIALRPFKEKICEMKRLYIRPEFRGNGFGKILVEKILQDAKDIGYNAICLDTLTSLSNAMKMYTNMGFKEIQPYYYNPCKNVVYFYKEL